MALLFMDSFDHYATADLTTKWSSSLTTAGAAVSSIAAAAGRRGSSSFRVTVTGPPSGATSGVQKVLTPGDANGVLGFSFSCSTVAALGSTGLSLASFRDVATPQLTLRLNPNMTLTVLRGTAIAGTVLGTTVAALSVGATTYVEWKVLIHPSAGTVDIRFNGVSALSLTAQNTRNTTNSSWNTVGLGIIEAGLGTWGSTGTLDWDDLYVLDGTGSAPLNTFLGDVRVDPRYPTGAGATTGWTPSAAPNWGCVDETAPNGDTDYVATSTVGVTDTYATQDAAVPGATIYGIQHCVNLKKMDAGTCTVAPVIRHSGVDYPGADLSPGVAYAYGLQVAAVNPGTGVAWTEAGFNAAEFGYKKTV